MAAQQIGVVSATRGEVFARGVDGKVRRLEKGDAIFEGDVIVTAAGSTAEITPLEGPKLQVAEMQSVTMDKAVASGEPRDPSAGSVNQLTTAEAAQVIQDFNTLLEDEAAAAGLAGGGSEGGHSFVDLLRIVEEIGGVSYAFPGSPEGQPPQITGEGLINGLPSAGEAFAAVNEDAIALVEGNPGGIGDIGTDVLATATGNLNYSFGPDGPAGSGAFRWLGVTLPEGDLYSGGSPVILQISDDGLILRGIIESGGGEDQGEEELVFEAVMLDPLTGAYELTLYRALDHVAGENENDLPLVLNFRITDLTGDTADGTLNLTVDDDTPVLLGGSGEGEFGNVVTGIIYGTAYLNQGQGEDSEGEPPTSTVDSWFFTVNSAGNIIIDTRSMEPNGIDVNGDGEIAYFDPYIYVFTNDNGQPGTLIASNDDSSSTYGDGSIHAYDSYLSLNLPAGSYILKIGAYYLSEEEARSGVNQDSYYPIGQYGPIDHGDYQITFHGDVTVTAGPGGQPGDVVKVEEESVPLIGGNDEPEGLSYTATGTIVDDVAWGADGFGALTRVTVGAGEDAVTFDVLRGGAVSVYFDAYGQLIADQANTDYTGEWPSPALEVQFNSDGTYTVTVLTAMNHSGEDEDVLQLPAFSVTGVDFDGDPVDVPLAISIQDDVPVLRDAHVSATVDEDDIKTNLSSGNYPNDGAGEDGSWTGSPYSWHDSGPANVSGSLAALVSFGADGPGNNGFSLATNPSGLDEQGLSSKSESLAYEVIDGVLYGYVPSGGQGGEDDYSLLRTPQESDFPVDGRVVFTLQLNSAGDYTFSLYDQLDHPAGEDENNLAIDLSSAIVATDGDGDSITLQGNFTINVTDDVPKEAGYLPEIGKVEEEGLPGGNPEGRFNPTVAAGWLTSQVSVGADEQVTFSLSGNTSGLPSLTSNDEPVSYRVEGDTLYAEVLPPIGEDGGEPRTVFTLRLEENGHYTFTLLDQVDHSGYGEDWMTIDLSSMIVATDYDGDSLTLNRDFYIKIGDDIPVVSVGGPGAVAEDAAEPINGTWSVSMGADQTGSIKVVVNGDVFDVGTPIRVVEGGQNVGTLTVNQNGTWTFDPNPNLDNDRDTKFSFEIRATDADGDTVKDSQTIRVTDGADPRGGDAITLALDEEALDNASATGTNPPSAAEQVSNTLTFTAGSDDLSSFAFSSYLSNLVRNTDGSSGNELRWVRSPDGQTVTGYFTGTSDVAITLSLSAPASIAYGTTGTVTVTATLSDNLKHAIANGEQTLDLGSIRVYAYDHDGDSTYGTVRLSVKDDVPSILPQGAQEFSYTLTLTNHDHESSAGYHNSYGYYVKDANGNPTTGMVIWDDVHDSDTTPVTVTGYSPDQIGFFLIPNGDNLNESLADNTAVRFEEVNGQWQAFIDDGSNGGQGTPLVGAGSHVLFDLQFLNKDGQGHVADNGLDGNQNWEDLQIPAGDGDFNDVNIHAEWTSAVQVDIPALVNFGADGPGSIVITSLPSSGTVKDAEGNVVNVNDTVTGKLTYEPSNQITLGDRFGGGTLDSWGVIQGATTGSITVNGILATVAFTEPADRGDDFLRIYNNDANHIGGGTLADNDGQGLNSGETITVTFDHLMTHAEIGVDGLGNHFLPDASQQAHATWEAWRGDVLVASGELDNPQGQNQNSLQELMEEFTISIGEGFDKLVFGNNSLNSGSNYEIRYIKAEAKVDTAIGYQVVDGDGDTADGTYQIEIVPGGQATKNIDYFIADADQELSDIFRFGTDAIEPMRIEEDIVQNFDAANDKLDLRDMLQGETVDTIGDYLRVTTDGSDTIISVNVMGNVAESVDQTIRLVGIELDLDALKTSILIHTDNGSSNG
jgi:T1SS-143 domain-containing protein